MSEVTEIIVCTECGTEYPATKEYFTYSKSVDKKRILLRKVCRKCFNAKSNARYHNVVKNDPEKMEQRREHSRAAGATEERKEYMRKYRANNREHLNELERNRNKANPEKARERKERWLRSNKPKRLDVCRRYRMQNPEKVKESSRRYGHSERGLEMGRLHAQKRLAQKAELESTFTTEQWEECLRYFNNSCAYCGKSNDEVKATQVHGLEQDHFIALNNKGPYTKENIVPSCHYCNDSKSDRFFFNWYHKQPYYSLERENKILEYLNSQGKPIQQLTFAI